MADGFVFQVNLKEKSGGLLNVRGDSAFELRNNVEQLFGEGAADDILGAYYTNPRPKEAPTTHDVAAAFNAEVVATEQAPAPLASVPDAPPVSTAPVVASDSAEFASCPVCHTPKSRFVQGGVSKAGKPYPGFYACNTKGCKGRL